MATLAAWIAVVVGMAAITHWFNLQPYGVPQLSPFTELKMAMKKPAWEVNVSARLLLMVLLLVLPAAVPFLWRSLQGTLKGGIFRKLIVALAMVVLVAALFIHPSLASIPWIPSTLNWEGINGSFPLPGRPIVLTRPIRFIVSVSVYLAACILAGELTGLLTGSRRILLTLFDPEDEQFALYSLTIFNILYFGLLVVRLADIEIFDRYLLFIVPWAATVFLLYATAEVSGTRNSKTAMPLAWVFLGLYAVYGIASTQDYWALGRARVCAASRLIASGVPRTSIDGGSEYNKWTELEKTGRINSHWVVNPPGAYNPALGETPSVLPLYRLEFEPSPDTLPSPFGSVPYYSALPPFRKQVSIDRILSPQPFQ